MLWGPFCLHSLVTFVPLERLISRGVMADCYFNLMVKQRLVVYSMVGCFNISHAVHVICIAYAFTVTRSQHLCEILAQRVIHHHHT